MHSVCHSLPAGRFFVRRAFVEQEAEERPPGTRQCHRVCVSSNATAHAATKLKNPQTRGARIGKPFAGDCVERAARAKVNFFDSRLDKFLDGVGQKLFWTLSGRKNNEKTRDSCRAVYLYQE